MGKLVLPGVLIGIGLAVVLVAVIAGFVVVPNLIESGIEVQTRLENGSDTYGNWEENPVPVYLKFYLFHVNNPKGIEENQKPNLTERGPYVYSEVRRKHVSNIDNVTSAITYKQTIHYTFEESLSIDTNGKQLRLSDKINVVNLPFITLATRLYSMDFSSLSEWFVRMFISQKESFVKEDVTVGEVLFDGWEYPSMYKTLLDLAGGEPPQFKDGRFGFYRGNEGANDGEYVIDSGINNPQNIGRITSWNGLKKLTWWDNPTDPKFKLSDPKYCNAINGTDGSIFPPFLTTESILPVYTTDLCRSISFVYEKEDVHRDISGYKFTVPQAFFDHPKDNNNNYCFCPSPPHPGLESTCAKGIMRQFGCRDGGPLVSSSPHFYNGDELYINKLIGMNPDKNLHETFVLLQPDSGLPMKLRKRIQINLEIQNFQNDFVTHFNNIPYTLFPALWASEETELNKKLADEMKSKLITPMTIVDITKWVLIGIGGLITVIGIVILVRRKS